MVLDGTYFTTTTPFLEFSIQFQSNNLIYDKGYNKRQQVIYSLILLLRQEGLGYRKISRKLNQWGIKTHRGKKWFNTSVSSVLKRKHEREMYCLMRFVIVHQILVRFKGSIWGEFY